MVTGPGTAVGMSGGMPPEWPGGVGGPTGSTGGDGVGTTADAKVKPPGSVATVPSEFITVTFTGPGAWARTVAVIVVVSTITTIVGALPPKRTVVPAPKPTPWIVKLVAPLACPVAGVMVAMASGEKAVRWLPWSGI